jgi:hypothetical protein
MRAFIVILLCATACFAGQMPSRGQGAPWRLFHFNEGSGSITIDSVAGSTASITGASWVDGKFGKGLNFSGGNTQVATYDATSTTLTNYGFMFWAKPNMATGWTGIVGLEGIGHNLAILFLVNTAWGSPAQATGAFTFSSDVGTQGSAALGMVSNKWYFVGISFKNGHPTIYINGSKVSMAADTESGVTSFAPTIYIGNVPISWGTNASFPGSLDEFAIFNGGFSWAQYQSAYISGIGRHQDEE